MVSFSKPKMTLFQYKSLLKRPAFEKKLLDFLGGFSLTAKNFLCRKNF